jgi:hypothetical protein
MTNTDRSYKEDMQVVTQALLEWARKRVTSRRDRVLLFASALRRTLDDLPPEDRGAEYVTRTWELPVLAPASQKVMERIWKLFERASAQHRTRAVVLERAVQLTVDDLSPDERIRMVASAREIIDGIRTPCGCER